MPLVSLPSPLHPCCCCYYYFYVTFVAVAASTTVAAVVVVVVVVIVIIIIISFMHGIYTYVIETNHVSTEYSVAAVL